MQPHIICYMMTSLDGRIDCAMTSHLAGVDNYYQVLDDLDLPSTLSGRVTAELEMALQGHFEPITKTPFGQAGFSKKIVAKGYEIIVDTKGTLLWNKETSLDKPHLIVTGINVNKEYLDYLDAQNISWIACGDEQVDLKKAMEILSCEFAVKRLGVVGGPAINTAFLEAGLLNEIVVLIGPGIDGRVSMPSVFEGRKKEIPLPLKLTEVKQYPEGDVLLKYSL